MRVAMTIEIALPGPADEMPEGTLETMYTEIVDAFEQQYGEDYTFMRFLSMHYRITEDE